MFTSKIQKPVGSPNTYAWMSFPTLCILKHSEKYDVRRIHQQCSNFFTIATAKMTQFYLFFFLRHLPHHLLCVLFVIYQRCTEKETPMRLVNECI